MKLGLVLSSEDIALTDRDLLAKGMDALSKALRQARPRMAVHVHEHALDGGDMAFVNDLSDRMASAYQARCDRMLQDIADFLISNDPTDGTRS